MERKEIKSFEDQLRRFEEMKSDLLDIKRILTLQINKVDLEIRLVENTILMASARWIGGKDGEVRD